MKQTKNMQISLTKRQAEILYKAMIVYRLNAIKAMKKKGIIEYEKYELYNEIVETEYSIIKQTKTQ